MRRLFVFMLLGALAGIVSVPAQDNGAQPTVIQTFDNAGSLTTAPFQVPNQWEVRWTCHAPVTITVYAADHTVVAGTMGVYSGSFFLAAGGNYYLQIDGPKPPAPVNASPDATGTTATPNGANEGGTTNGNPQLMSRPGGPDQLFRWNVQVVALGTASNAVPPAPAAVVAPPAPVGKMTEEQAHAVVLITGDNGEGTGFLIKTPDGPAVVTNIHVIANNPNLKITTNTGALITMLSAKGASDRDVALLAIQDAGYSYLDVSTDISRAVQLGDEVLTPGNSQGGEVMLNTAGKVLGIGPERIEFDNPIYHGNSGGPVFHTKSNKVLGVVTEATKVTTDDALDKASFASRNSAISGSMRYFGLRLDTVSGWVPIEWNRFQVETAFLDQFHDKSRYLDAYLNGKNSNNPNGREDATIYRKDDKIMKANARYVQQVGGADTAQRLESLRGLLFDLNGIVDTDMDQIQNMNNFYPFDQLRARDEISYRKALKAELDSIGNDVDRLSTLPRTNN